MKTILLIEDENAQRDMVRTYLELNEFSVMTASNGKDGIELAKRIVPDLIISDVMMPQVDGFQMKEELSKDELTSTIPFIFLTSMSARENLRKGMELGAEDYLFKPVALDELKRVIELQLAKRERLLHEYIQKSPKPEQKEYSYNSRVLLKDKGVPRFVKVESIHCITAEDKYTKVYLLANEKIISSNSLINWEELLPPANFVRIHRNTLVNIDYIEKVEKWFNRGYRVKLKGIEEKFEISRRHYTKIREVFGGE